MKNILFISQSSLWTMGPGKGAPSLWLPLKGYLEKGYRVFFVENIRNKEEINDDQTSYPNLFRFSYRTILLEKSKHIKYLRHFARFIWWIYSQLRVLFIAYKILKKEEISLFVVNGPTQVPIVKLLSSWKNIPLIVKYRGTLQMLYIDKPFYFIRCWIMIIAMNIPVDLIIMTNDGNQGDKVLEMHGVKKSAYKFWVNGVEKLSPDIYIEDKAKKEYLDKKIIFMACQLVEEKGVHLMIEAMPDIIKKHKDVVLIVAGTGNQKVKLEKSAKYLGISNHIDFLGAVEWDKLKTYYKLAHIFVSLYRYSNMGNPTLEAMAWGKCIVTLNHFDTNKFIFNNETGMLLNDIQIQDLSNIISDLLVDERKLRRLGFKAKEFARNNLWVWDKRVSAEIYEIERLIREYQKCKN